MSRLLVAIRAAVLACVLAFAAAGCGQAITGERLQIRAGDFNVLPGACPLGLAPPFRMERDGNELVFVDVDSGERLAIVWPFGFAAWLERGRAVLYASDGMVVGREGDVLDDVGGGTTGDGDAILVCAIGVRTYS